MRKTLATAVALAAIAAAFAAAAPGGTHPAGQRVRIEVKGTDPFTFVLKPTSPGRVKPDVGSAMFCCWTNWTVNRAGTKLDVSNPRLTLVRAHPGGNSAHPGGNSRASLNIREQIEWVDLPDGWQVCTGTWKVVGGSGDYARFSGHGRVACAWAPETDPNRALRIRLFGFLESK